MFHVTQSIIHHPHPYSNDSDPHPHYAVFACITIVMCKVDLIIMIRTLVHVFNVHHVNSLVFDPTHEGPGGWCLNGNEARKRLRRDGDAWRVQEGH